MQSVHAPPPDPQLVFCVPELHVPVELDQQPVQHEPPWQVPPVQLVPSLASPIPQLPLVQVVLLQGIEVVGQVVQGPPPLPQLFELWPLWQPSVAMQPWQQLPPLHLPPVQEAPSGLSGSTQLPPVQVAPVRHSEVQSAHVAPAAPQALE